MKAPNLASGGRKTRSRDGKTGVVNNIKCCRKIQVDKKLKQVFVTEEINCKKAVSGKMKTEASLQKGKWVGTENVDLRWQGSEGQKRDIRFRES